MAAGTRWGIVLDSTTQDLLHRVTRARTVSVREARAARILLLRDQGIPCRTIAQSLHCGTATIAKTCRRFVEGGWDAVCRERPRGRPRSYPPGDIQAVLGWAQTAPQAHNLPITRWSLTWVQHCWRTSRRAAPPARSTLRRWYRAIRLPWYRIRSWCTSSDPQYHAKLTAICHAYRLNSPDIAVLCYDQKPHLQALGRRVPLRPSGPDRPGRREHGYRRNGTVDLHGLYDIRSGQCLLACRPNHNQETIAGFLLETLRQWPQPRIFLIVDNLAANHAPAVRQALQRIEAEQGKTITVLPTPTHSSWANQIERLFADLQRGLLDYLEVPSTQALDEALQHWSQWRSLHPTPFKWTYHPDSALRDTGH